MDPDGIILGPGFHDGTLYGLTIHEDKSLHIEVKNYLGAKFEIVLNGVAAMNVLNFIGISIIGDVWLWKTDAAPHTVREKLFSQKLSESQMRLELSRASHFFAIDSAYGAEIYALCDNINISSIS